MTTNSRAEKFSKCPHNRVQDYTEICLDCGESVYSTVKEINLDEGRKERSQQDKNTWDKDNTGW